MRRRCSTRWSKTSKTATRAGRLFELANVYIPKQQPVTERPEERMHLGLAAFGESEDFFALKGAIEALGESFGIEFGFTRAADVPWLHPGIAAYLTCEGEDGRRVRQARERRDGRAQAAQGQPRQPENLPGRNRLAGPDGPTAAPRCATPRCRPTRLSRATWPLSPTRRPPCGDIVAEMRRACKQLADVQLFDIYRSEAIGAGKKSMAFTLHFAAQDAPLAPDEVDRFVKKILGNLKYRMGIEMR